MLQRWGGVAEEEGGVTDAVRGMGDQGSHSYDMENEVLERIEVSCRTYTDMDGC